MLRALMDQFFLTLRLVRDPRVPLWAKAVPFLALAYVVSPVDIIPDFILVLGQLDDIALLIGGMRLLESLAPEYVVAEHRALLARRHEPLEIIEAPSAKRKNGRTST